MYANEEDIPLISSSTVPIKKKGEAWKFLMGFVTLSAIGLLVVSLNGGISKSTSPSAIAAALTEERVKMSKAGTLQYTSLNEGETRRLFSEYIGNFGKQVCAILNLNFLSKF